MGHHKLFCPGCHGNAFLSISPSYIVSEDRSTCLHAQVLVEMKSGKLFLPGLALNNDPFNPHLSSREDYRCDPPAPDCSTSSYL
jgi:hypothetical protein